ncbi:MAG: hypothetical protein ACR2P4_07010 [Gammaproteobacteria bacterium]
MNKIVSWVVLFILLLASIVLLIWAFYRISPDFWASIFAALVSFWGYVFVQKRKEEKEHKNWLLRNKDACAVELIDIIYEPFAKGDATKFDHGKFEKRMKLLYPALLSWGSHALIEGWNEFQRTAANQNEKDMLKALERLLRSARYQLNHDDNFIKPGGVTATFITPGDKEKILRYCKSEKYEFAKTTGKAKNQK